MALQSINLYDYTDPNLALQLSRNAPIVLSRTSLAPSALPLSLFSAAETPEDWAELEQTFYACLRVEDDESAHKCLELLSKRFGADNERLIAMWGLYKEAVAKDQDALRLILQDYNKALEANPMNIPVHKRRIALIRSVGKPAEAISSLVQFLESFPTDTEAWCELSDLYQSQGLGAQAIFSLEEALLTVPNAWNLQARLGELNLLASRSGQEGSEAEVRHLVEATHRFSRSIELCDDYLRGYYGLVLASESLMKLNKSNKNTPALTEDTVRSLHELATSKLRSIVQEWSSQRSATFSESEIIAAQALIDRKS